MVFFLLFLLILLNGFFSMSEIAIVSARKSRLSSSAKRGDRKARIALRAAESPNRFLSTVQIGITLIGILMGIYSGEHITLNLELSLSKIVVLAPYAHSLAVLIVVVVMTFFSLVLGELVPKRIGLSSPEWIARMVAIPMQWMARLMSPFVWLLTRTSDLLLAILPVRSAADSQVTEEEIKSILQEATIGGDVQEIEQELVERVFSMGDRKVSSLMTHRNDMVFLSLDMSPSEISEAVSEDLHTIYPVYEDDPNALIGVVGLKDLFGQLHLPGFQLKDHLHPVPYLSEQLSAYETLERFRQSKVTYGIIIDEFGQVEGMLTINDLLVALVGDASEFDEDGFGFLERSDGTWLVDGQYPLAEFFRRFDLDEMIIDYPFSTVGGLILHELKHVPEPGQVIQWHTFELEVVDMDRARIDKVIVRNIPA
ncbi:MAG: hemolysin family protein [Saprospiraceae bacterium]|nr:hemolysin family protein [Saprospiraceae bacterium]